jgi:hypothetical protein
MTQLLQCRLTSQSSVWRRAEAFHRLERLVPQPSLTFVVRRMTTSEVIIRLAAVGLLGAYLVARHRRRVIETPSPPEDASVWTGHGIDTRTLRPRLDDLRNDDCTATRTAPPLLEGARRRAWTRQVISCLAYFRHRHDHDDPEHQIA